MQPGLILAATFCALLPAYANITPVDSGNGVLISDFDELVRNNDDPSSSQIHFTVTAQAVFSRNPKRPLFLRSQAGLISFRVSVTNTLNYIAGDILTVSGLTSPLRHADPTYLVTNIFRAGHSSIPPPLTLGTNSGLCEALYASQVNVQGIVISAIQDDIDSEWNWITIKNRNGNIYGAIPNNEYPIQKLYDLVDAEISVTGLVLRPGNWRNAIGHHLMIDGRTINIITPAPSCPQGSPLFKGAHDGHRKSIKGTVVASSASLLFIRTSNGLTIPAKPIAGTDMPKTGASIIAFGFVVPAVLGFQLLEAIIQYDTDTAPLPVCKTTEGSVADLFSPAQDMRKSIRDSYGKILTATGVVAQTFLRDSNAHLIRLDVGSRHINIDVSGEALSSGDDLSPGCLVSITGVCTAMFESNITTLDFPRFKGFTLIPRSPADIIILRQSSWLTISRLLVVIGILLAAIILFSIWNRMLVIRSEQRGQELAAEKINRAKAESKVEERTRLAVELHDSISQTLTGVALQIDAATSACDDSKTCVAKFLTTAKRQLASCRNELQYCLWDLRSRTFAEKDMTEALEHTLSSYRRNAHLFIRFYVSRQNLSEPITHTILRIARELTINAIKHGHANCIKIAGVQENDKIRFSVIDNGIGFSKDNVPGPQEGHFGLQGVRERLKDLQGDLSISSVSGRTRILVSMFNTSPRNYSHA